MKAFATAGFALALLAAASVLPGTASAAELHVGTVVASSTADLGTSDNPYPTIAGAFAAAADGDTIFINGTATTTPLVINKAVSIKGINSGRIEASGSDKIFTITKAGVTISDLQIAKLDKTSVSGLIGIQASSTVISNNQFTGQYAMGDGEVVRGLEISTVDGFTVTGNTFTALRQPAYINDNATGTVSSNSVSGTRGWVVVANSNVTFTGNTFSGNVVDIAFIPGTPNNYTDINAISAANNGAVIENQATLPASLSKVFVDAAAAPGGNGLQSSPYKTITEALNRVTATGTISVAAGSYTENVTVNKAVTIEGPNAGVAGTGTRVAEAVITGSVSIYSGDVSFKGFTVTNPSWNGVSVKGIYVYGDGPEVVTNVNISNNVVTAVNNSNTKGAYGIMVQGVVSGITVDGNKIDSIVSAGWARGIEVTPTAGSTVVPQNVTITNNSIMGVSSATGDEYDFSSDWASGNGAIADASQITFKRNSMNGFKIKNLDTNNALNATENWWGSAAPDFATTTATGTVSTKPWYIDAGLTTLYTDPTVAPVAPTPGEPTSARGGGSSSGFSAPIVSVPSAPSTGGTGQVLGIETYNFAQNLRYGMRNNDVLELQKRLAAEGIFKVTPTGYFGPITLLSVKIYQASHQIKPVSGFVGPLTRAELNK
ncbi:MAG TPA: peptidoglycan-binding protein [Candidatus Paceibacterota bacterium]